LADRRKAMSASQSSFKTAIADTGEPVPAWHLFSGVLRSAPLGQRELWRP